MKVAVIQLNSGPIKKKNIAQSIDFILSAIKHKAEFILLPEVFNYRGRMTNIENIHCIAEPIPGDSIIPFKEIARQNKVYILAGSIYERVKSSKKTYNTSVLINDKGIIQATYRKIHLFDAVVNNRIIKESNSFLRGEQPTITSIKGIKAGLSICYDVRFPELYNNYSSKGVSLLCIPSNFTKQTGQAHWEILLRARAIENLCFVLAPNQTGKDERGTAAYGNSMIIDPWGKILSRGSGQREEIIYSDIDILSIKEYRKMMPTLKHKVLLSSVVTK
ncbi:MAG: carbon-nitrogen hydrolase family protein [Spirochaetota bacterium]|nr:carbon-nitrogen hydrolase family protein [Spirochaetota bacterium]